MPLVIEPESESLAKIRAAAFSAQQQLRLMGISIVDGVAPITVDRLDDALETLRREVTQLQKDFKTNKQMTERLDIIVSTIDQASKESKELKADILFPLIEDMSVRLVPSDSLDRLEEYRSDVNWAYLLAGAFLGAVMGILSNWATNEKFIITRCSKVLIGLFLILAVGSGVWAYNINRRARRVRDHMFYRGIKPMGNRQLKKEPLSADTEPKAEDDANQTG